jgi:hypothetical protein
VRALLVTAVGVTMLPATVAAATTRQSVYDVRAFGAAGDGKTLDTTAINKAIEAAAAGGGGTVLFSGWYLPLLLDPPQEQYCSFLLAPVGHSGSRLSSRARRRRLTIRPNPTRGTNIRTLVTATGTTA